MQQIYIWPPSPSHTHTQAHAHTHTNTHTQIHTHTHTLLLPALMHTFATTCLGQTSKFPFSVYCDWVQTLLYDGLVFSSCSSLCRVLSVHIPAGAAAAAAAASSYHGQWVTASTSTGIGGRGPASRLVTAFWFTWTGCHCPARYHFSVKHAL